MRWTLVAALMLGCWSNSKPPSSHATSNVTGSGNGSAVSASAPTGPLPPGCKRMRQTFVYNCSGVPPGPGESNSSPTTACDECLASTDCTAQPGGQCEERGDQMCSGPRRFVCLYPDPACGNQICKERVVAPPP